MQRRESPDRPPFRRSYGGPPGGGGGGGGDRGGFRGRGDRGGGFRRGGGYGGPPGPPPHHQGVGGDGRPPGARQPGQGEGSSDRPGAEPYREGASHRGEWSRQQPAALVVKLTGMDTRTVAETLRGRYLEVPEEAVRPLPEGRWYHHQLVGLAVRAESGRDLGTLTEVVTRPANDVWVAQRDDGGELLVPVIPDA